MRRVTIAAWTVTALSVSFFANDSFAEYSGDAFATCSACHLPDGVGVPGAFPPVRNRAATIAGLDGGRDYLITVVTYGLMGTIQVDGVGYNGRYMGAK